MSNLQDQIKQIYQGNITDQESILAESNLLGFFKVLEQIETRLQSEKFINNNFNESKNENNRGKNRSHQTK